MYESHQVRYSANRTSSSIYHILLMNSYLHSYMYYYVQSIMLFLCCFGTPRPAPTHSLVQEWHNMKALFVLTLACWLRPVAALLRPALALSSGTLRWVSARYLPSMTTTAPMDDIEVGYVTDVEGNLGYFDRWVAHSGVLRYIPGTEELELTHEGAYFVFGGQNKSNTRGDPGDGDGTYHPPYVQMASTSHSVPLACSLNYTSGSSRFSRVGWSRLPAPRSWASCTLRSMWHTPKA